MTARLKSLGALAVLTVLSVPVAVAVAAAVVRRATGVEEPARPSGRTVLLTGGKMTKSLQLARMFAALGDRVIVGETAKYRYCGTRFSRAVDRFVVLPDFGDDGEDYADALLDVVLEEGVDLFVPVASPAAAHFDALAKPRLAQHTEVFHFDADVVDMLDDKFAFCERCHDYGLSAPEVHRIESPTTLLNFVWPAGKRYVLKSIAYDPVYRLDLRTLPHPGWQDRVRALPISAQQPWVLQEFVEGREVCTHSTVRDGEVMLYICCDSSPFQVNYDMLDLPDVYEWVSTFLRKLGGTGQASFDFIVQSDGQVMPIECNPRTHSAITLFHDQLEGAQAYYAAGEPGAKQWRPHTSGRPTYWLYHELWRWVCTWRPAQSAVVREASCRDRQVIWRRVREGKEAVFRWDDPLPFLFINHVQIPMLLVGSLLQDQGWERIDFNIGKLVTAGGD